MTFDQDIFETFDDAAAKRLQPVKGR